MAPKITDFGLAKFLDGVGDRTRTGAIVGSPSYMAPEQAGERRAVIGPAADVWALGAILYECLTGRPPFQGETVLETLELVRTVEPVPPSQLQPRLARDLDTICLKCLRKDPACRYTSAADLAEDLRRVQEGWPIRARPTSVAERVLKWTKRRPLVAGLLAAILLLAAGSLVVITWQWRVTLAALEEEEKQRKAAEVSLASRNLAVAELCYATHEFAKARDHLAQVPLHLRDRHWDRVHRYCYAERVRVDGKPFRWVAWRPGGEQVVACTFRDDAVLLYDARTGALQNQFRWRPTTDHPAWRYALAPDGQSLLILHPGPLIGGLRRETNELRGLDLRDGAVRLLASFPLQGGRSPSVFSPGSRWIAATMFPNAGKREVGLWDTATMKQARGLRTDSRYEGALSLSPDGKYLAQAGRDGEVTKIEVLDFATGAVVNTLRRPAREGRKPRDWPVLLTDVEFSPDSKRLLYGVLDTERGRRSVNLWDVETGKTVLTLSRETAGAGSVMKTFSPDGKRLAFLGDRSQIYVHDVATGEELVTLRGHTEQLHSIAFSPDGRRLATCGGDLTLRIWDIDPSPQPPTTSTGEGK